MKDDNELYKLISKEVLNKTWDNDIKTLSKKISKKMALDIKKWRVGDGPDDLNTHSWRSVATMFCMTYPDEAYSLNIADGNQISGIHLCDAAMLKLKETVDQGWN